MRSTLKTHLEKEALPLLLAFLLAAMPLLAGDPLPQATPQQAAPVQNPAAPAQTPAAPAPAVAAPAAPLPTVQGLKVIPLAGKGETNDLEKKIMAPIVIEVLDQEDRPLEGAEVVFRFPMSGPGAAFSGGKTSQTVRTNIQGQAAAMNWQANDQVGRFDVHVNASYGNQVGETTFQMANAPKVLQHNNNIGTNPYTREKRGWFSPLWVKIAVIGGAAALTAGIILATRGSGSTAATPPTITITPGSPTVGAPQ